MSVAHLHRDTPHLIACASCAQEFDTMTSLWCRCVAKEFTPACPRCGSCVCKVGRSAIAAFWRTAPDELRQRRRAEIRRRESAPHALRATAPTVLVVDDDEEIRLMAEFALHEMGYRTIAAGSPAEALRLLETEKPLVVLTDALMPGGDGRELCRTIKLRHPNVKVVIMTSLYTAPRYATEARKDFLSDGYLAKPVDFDRLRDVIRRLA